MILKQPSLSKPSLGLEMTCANSFKKVSKIINSVTYHVDFIMNNLLMENN